MVTGDELPAAPSQEREGTDDGDRHEDRRPALRVPRRGRSRQARLTYVARKRPWNDEARHEQDDDQPVEPEYDEDQQADEPHERVRGGSRRASWPPDRRALWASGSIWPPSRHASPSIAFGRTISPAGPVEVQSRRRHRAASRRRPRGPSAERAYSIGRRTRVEAALAFIAELPNAFLPLLRRSGTPPPNWLQPPRSLHQRLAERRITGSSHRDRHSAYDARVEGPRVRDAEGPREPPSRRFSLVAAGSCASRTSNAAGPAPHGRNVTGRLRFQRPRPGDDGRRAAGRDPVDRLVRERVGGASSTRAGRGPLTSGRSREQPRDSSLSFSFASLTRQRPFSCSTISFESRSIAPRVRPAPTRARVPGQRPCIRPRCSSGCRGTRRSSRRATARGSRASGRRDVDEDGPGGRGTGLPRAAPSVR